ncbi:hypothetical protein K9L27_02655 [Candidatus Gracilibacteria bacterium]|nr:hypothetical protein [Candidatus Gracilibacteria bacterium]
METTYFLAKVFGVFFVVAGLGMLFNLKYYKKVMEDFLKNGALMYFAGLVTMIAGLVMVLYHGNIWTGGWVVLITVLAWISFLKGICLLLFPSWMSGWKKCMCTETWAMVGGVVMLLLGLYILYMAGMLMFLM